MNFKKNYNFNTINCLLTFWALANRTYSFITLFVILVHKKLIIRKIDLEKVYVKIEWNFIEKMPEFYKFPPNLISLIMSCITTSNISILFNGEKMETFKSFRGIRQGDLIFPYIFNLRLEYSGLLIQEKIIVKEWSPISTSIAGPTFSHFFSANNIILETKASLRDVDYIKTVHNNFAVSSGLRISLEQSKVFFSNNTP